MDLIEVYRIIYRGPGDDLRGNIISMDILNKAQFLLKDKDIEKFGYQHLFKEMGVEVNNIRELVNWSEECPEVAEKQLRKTTKPRIKHGDHILLTGPTFSLAPFVGIFFHLFGIFHTYEKFGFGDDDLLSVPLRKVVMGDKYDNASRSFTVLYAKFENAGEASINIKLTKINSDFHVYGIVAARTSAIQERTYSSIIFFKDKDGEKITAGPEDEMILPLLRPVVAVPHGSELILQLNLFTDDNDTLAKDIVSFKATKGETSSEPITRICNKCVIEIGVSWRWTIKLVDDGETRTF